ncbi:glycosyl hydrolase family 18 protein [Spiroplasma culicicola]|uniref:chitinase n=1 Tax=Spiroplasma culicicola AES-1 TaxID=1276246 RepID=W6AH87_9MOLU|nr:glycosyl hydrolase family 18 protein [Spiroplasma culicicola]AHI53054.1 chitinase [Spiroplasma culicicola AES-1]
MKKLLYTMSATFLPVIATNNVVSCFGGEKPLKPTPPPVVPGDMDKVLVGYWYDWGGAYQEVPKLEEIHSSYNVINLSFLYSKEAYQMPVFEYYGISKEALIAGIEYQHSLGHKVLISMGGATGNKMRFKMNQKDELKQTILKVINEYNLDGLDIDWEGDCLADRESQLVTSQVLKEIKNEWAAEGRNFYITMAPEMPYLKNSTETSGGSYIPFLKELDDYYDWINPQFYNGWAFGPYVEPTEATNLGLTPYYIVENDNVELRSDFFYLMTKYMTTTYSPKNDFYLIDPERFVMGAATNEPAGRGAASQESIIESYEMLVEDEIYTKGLMTWALNYDNFEGTISWDWYSSTYFKRWSFASWYDQTHGQE